METHSKADTEVLRQPLIKTCQKQLRLNNTPKPVSYRKTNGLEHISIAIAEFIGSTIEKQGRVF